MLQSKHFASAFLYFIAASLPFAAAHAQDQSSGPWVMQSSGTRASLRGIHAAGSGVAWASGTNGTILRTEDGGYMWQSCAMPPGADKLDFRGIWAWDANTAIVMSSGPGDQSRLYYTSDGCSSWKLAFTNPDKDGFWDAIQFSDPRDGKHGFILGDPVNHEFVLFFTVDQGKTWRRAHSKDLGSGNAKIGAFAASNSALTLAMDGLPIFGTSGPGGPWLYVPEVTCTSISAQLDPGVCYQKSLFFEKQKLPMAAASASAGIFSLAVDSDVTELIAVGGDYSNPNEIVGTAAVTRPYMLDPARRGTTAATKPPHGYRSAVAWDADANAWITVGTNGSDISYDDGKTWTPLDDGNWNALSLPWVVGPDGRIAKLGALPPKK
jgi:hypothetical protein